MKLGVLFSGGKDSTYSAFLAKEKGHELICLISLISKNPDSYMFHTPAINLVEKQAKLMNLPLIKQETLGEKEKELEDLEKAIKKAIEKYKIQGIVTGALKSSYQKSRIESICKSLKIKCLNPLWNKDQIELLNELIKNNFEIIISGVAAYPLDNSWIGRKIDLNFIKEIEELSKRYKLNPAGEGGEFESLVINCPLFKNNLKISLKKIIGENYSFRGIFK
ncbi:diphthine--ammonia ligase [Candidatus Woesearchaeota archaeon]|jgi:asparagine synthase (glutamine-hydrolysing)|nr:diphthine--ammonia ligase [Candidatus Woesearchaeota archaeon]